MRTNLSRLVSILRSALSRLGGGARSLAGQVVVVVVDRAQRFASGVAPRVESAVQLVERAPGVEQLAARREALKTALAEYLLRTVTVAAPMPDAAPAPSPGVLHLTRLVELRLGQLRHHREFWRDEDPVEAVHQLRVASRRLRAFVDLFSQFLDSGEVLRAERKLKGVTKAVGHLRDADVMLIDLEKRLALVTSDEERAALGHVLKKARRRRGKLAKKAAASAKEFDVDGLAGLLRAMLDQLALRASSPSTTYELLAELTFDRVLDETRRAFPKLAHLPRADELHRFRVKVKRLRYAAELVEPVLGQRFGAIHTRAKKIQDVLGDHQDRVVLGETLERQREKIAGDRHPGLVKGLDRVLLRVRGEREQLFQRFNAEYGQLSGPHLFAR